MCTDLEYLFTWITLPLSSPRTGLSPLSPPPFHQVLSRSFIHTSPKVHHCSPAITPHYRCCAVCQSASQGPDLHKGKSWALVLFVPTTIVPGSLICNICSYCCSVAKSCPALCEPMGCSMPGSPFLHYLLEFAQIRDHWVGDTIQLFHPLPPPSSFAFNLSQHQGLSQLCNILYCICNI